MQIKSLRLNNRKTQEEVAQDIGITQFTLSNYENEKTEPDIATLIKLADYYNVSLDYLCNRQYNNQIGYIPDEKKDGVKLLLCLNEQNYATAFGYISGLLATQN